MQHSDARAPAAGTYRVFSCTRSRPLASRPIARKVFSRGGLAFQSRIGGTGTPLVLPHGKANERRLIWIVSLRARRSCRLLHHRLEHGAGSNVPSANNQQRGHAMIVGNPKVDPPSPSNTEKDPDDWVSGDEPMTGAQASYLKTLSEQLGEPDEFSQSLTKAEASKRIDTLKSRLEQKR
jgi:hypothetical protein